MRYFLISLSLLIYSALLSRADEIPKDGTPQNELTEGFVTQSLEPTGGNILKPKDWFYVEGHRDGTLMWTLTKEDTKNGKDGYETGVRIQAFTDVKKRTGKTAQLFIEDFLAQKKKSATKVHGVRELVNQGIFSRIGIEITQGGDRVLYSLFYSDHLDMAVISIAGTKTDKWNDFGKIFDQMSVFELFDLKRIKEAPQKTKKENKADSSNGG